MSRTPFSLSTAFFLAAALGMAQSSAAQISSDKDAVPPSIAQPSSADAGIKLETDATAPGTSLAPGAIASATRPLDLAQINLAEFGDIDNSR